MLTATAWLAAVAWPAVDGLLPNWLAAPTGKVPLLLGTGLPLPLLMPLGGVALMARGRAPAWACKQGQDMYDGHVVV